MVQIFTDHFVVRDRMNQSSKGETTRLKAIRSLMTKSVSSVCYYKLKLQPNIQNLTSKI